MSKIINLLLITHYLLLLRKAACEKCGLDLLEIQIHNQSRARDRVYLQLRHKTYRKSQS
jgi:predicted Zn-ribbon and HTH transcriptional regulator